MWTFKTSGDGEQATGFEATFDGPVEDAGAALALIAVKAVDLSPGAGSAVGARVLCQESIDHVLALTQHTKNGKRRLSMNLSGGVGPQLAWSFILQVNLAEDPESE